MCLVFSVLVAIFFDIPGIRSMIDLLISATLHYYYSPSECHDVRVRKLEIHHVVPSLSV